MTSLKNNVIALQSAGKIVPSCRYEGVFSLKILDLLFRGGLFFAPCMSALEHNTSVPVP